MAVIADHIKAFIVMQLACYDSPSTVSEAVKEEFDVVVGRSQIQSYDPTKFAGRNLSARWRALFEETREKFKKETNEIPIAQKAVRLRALERVLRRAEKVKNSKMVLQVTEAAAREVGEYFFKPSTNPSVTSIEGEVTVHVVGGLPDKPLGDRKYHVQGGESVTVSGSVEKNLIGASPFGITPPDPFALLDDQIEDSILAADLAAKFQQGNTESNT